MRGIMRIHSTALVALLACLSAGTAFARQDRPLFTHADMIAAKRLGAVAPIGGLFFILSWLFLAWAIWSERTA